MWEEASNMPRTTTSQRPFYTMAPVLNTLRASRSHQPILAAVSFTITALLHQLTPGYQSSGKLGMLGMLVRNRVDTVHIVILIGSFYKLSFLSSSRPRSCSISWSRFCSAAQYSATTLKTVVSSNKIPGTMRFGSIECSTVQSSSSQCYHPWLV